MDDYGYKLNHNLSQFVTTLKSGKNCSIHLIPKIFKNCDFLSISKYGLPFRNGYKPQFTQEEFKIVAISSRIPPRYSMKNEQDEFIRGEFIKKKMIKVLWQ